MTGMNGALARGDAAWRISADFPHRIGMLADVLSEPIRRQCAARWRIGLPDWCVLGLLGEHGTLTARDIGRLGRMHKTKVSRALGDLEERGLVARVQNASDLRESFVSLTAAGQALYAEITAVAAAYRDRLAAELSDEDRSTLEALLARMRARAEAVASEWGRAGPNAIMVAR